MQYLWQIGMLLIIEGLPQNPFLHAPFSWFYLKWNIEKHGEKTSVILKRKPDLFHSGSIAIATLMNSLSKKGTRASKPQADVDLFALRQSYWWSALICIRE